MIAALNTLLHALTFYSLCIESKLHYFYIIVRSKFYQVNARNFLPRHVKDSRKPCKNSLPRFLAYLTWYWDDKNISPHRKVWKISCILEFALLFISSSVYSCWHVLIFLAPLFPSTNQLNYVKHSILVSFLMFLANQP